MCSVTKALFGTKEKRSSEVYSVIHLRHLENIGKRLMDFVAKETGCDPRAALDMGPNYVKSILGPLGILTHPIVIISDGKGIVVLKKLMNVIMTLDP